MGYYPKFYASIFMTLIAVLVGIIMNIVYNACIGIDRDKEILETREALRQAEGRQLTNAERVRIASG